MTILKYNGNGEGIAGIPACDLDELDMLRLTEVLEISEPELITQLTSRGLYSLAAQPKAAKKTEPEPLPELIDSEE